MSPTVSFFSLTKLMSTEIKDHACTCLFHASLDVPRGRNALLFTSPREGGGGGTDTEENGSNLQSSRRWDERKNNHNKMITTFPLSHRKI